MPLRICTLNLKSNIKNKLENMAPWWRWLTRLPVTQKSDGSSPFGVAISSLAGVLEVDLIKFSIKSRRELPVENLFIIVLGI